MFFCPSNREKGHVLSGQKAHTPRKKPAQLTPEKRLAEIAVLRTHIINYSKTRDEMKELLTVKANVDRLMGYDEKRTEQEKERTPGR